MDYPFKICDPVHGFIRFGELEGRVIDSIPFQRLRYIRQMGVAYLVYPGATHSRFEHSLGVMELVTRIFNTIAKDLPQERLGRWRQILRWAALCHDLGHLPFSHTAEKELLPEGGHEGMTEELIRSPALSSIWRAYDKDAEEDIVKLAVGKGELLAQVITDDNFGADRIDYLVRDAYYTGVGYRFDFPQLIDSLRVLEGTLGVTQGGIQSVESLWIARYMMYARVYQHPKSRLYTAHMNRFMQRHYDRRVPYLEQTDFVVLTQLQERAKAGDRDALVLLKRIAPFEERGAAPLPKKEGHREFWVLTDEGTIRPSHEISPFLSQIPL